MNTILSRIHFHPPGTERFHLGIPIGSFFPFGFLWFRFTSISCQKAKILPLSVWFPSKIKVAFYCDRLHVNCVDFTWVDVNEGDFWASAQMAFIPLSSEMSGPMNAYETNSSHYDNFTELAAQRLHPQRQWLTVWMIGITKLNEKLLKEI